MTVVTPSGRSTTSGADQFNYYLPAPVVTGLSPSSGPVLVQTTVTISGSSLSNATAVYFGTLLATIMSDTDGQIVVQSPAASTPGPVDVTVVTPGGTSALVWADQFTYGAAPSISALIPSTGPSHDASFGLYIQGENLAGATAVYFGGVAGTIIDDRETFMYVYTPSEGAGTVDVTVVTPSGGTSAITPADQFTFVPGPYVSSIVTSASYNKEAIPSGPLAGGTMVWINGANLSDATAVNFGSTPVTSFVFIPSSNQIAVTTPPGVAGTVDVTVTSAEGTSATSAADQFTYVGVPTISGISPAFGPLAGGNMVVVTGTNLGTATEVDFGGVAVRVGGNSYVSYEYTQDGFEVGVPAGVSTGMVDVTVVTTGGASATSSADQYTYMPPPVVSGLSQTSGGLDGGATVTISGTRLSGATAVDFGGVAAASFTVNLDGTIAAVSPAGISTVDVTVTTPNGTSDTSIADQFTYVAPPIITAQDTYSGPVGGLTMVTLTGTSLAGATAVDFGANPGTIKSDTDGQIFVISPEATGDAPGPVDLAVTTPYGTSTGNFSFTYGLPPAVTAISPSSSPAAGGTWVTISGANLGSATEVDFGGVAAANFFVDNSNGTIAALSPGGAIGTVDVTVVTSYGTTAISPADQFTYLAVPSVSSVSPAAGPLSGGTSVTITGTALANATQVDFGGAPATSFTVDSDGTITAVSPAGAASTVDVTVVTAGGMSATSAADQFTYVAAPTLSGIGPSMGNASGGDIVTITGTNLDGATVVDFGLTTGTILYYSPSMIQAASPAGAAGLIDITVVAPGGTSTTSPADQFTYVGAPAATADSYSVTRGSTLTVAGPGVLANDTDPQGYALTTALLADPLHGTLSLNSDGSFTYTPNSGYLGADGFVYQASNGYFTSNPTLVSLTVGPATLTWDGGSMVNNLWTTKENWVGDVAPLAGDNLIFPAVSSQKVNFNDYQSGTAFGSITVSGSGYHFQGNAYQASTFGVQANTNIEVNSIFSDTLNMGAGSVLTITPIAGGWHAANSPLTPLATRALRPTSRKPISQPTDANTVAPSSLVTTTIAAEPLAVSTVLATPVPATSEVASALASSDSLSNTVLDKDAAPTEIIAEIAIPVRLMESTPARPIDTAINRHTLQSPLFSWLDLTALPKIIESGPEQSLITKNENITSKSILGSLSDVLPSHVSDLAKHRTTPAINSQQAQITALETIVQNSRWSYLDADAALDIGRHIRAGKHSNQFEKAIDEVLAEEEDAIPTLL